RAALAQAGALLAREPWPPGPALDRVLPLHLADPPLPGPRLPPRAAVGRRRRRTGAAGVAARDVGRLVLGPRARRGVGRALRRRRRALLPARARAVRARLARRVAGRGGRRDRRRRVRGVRRGPRGPAAGAAPARRLVGAQRARDDADRRAV